METEIEIERKALQWLVSAGFRFSAAQTTRSILCFQLPNVPGLVIHIMRIYPHNVYLYHRDFCPAAMGSFAADPKGMITAIKALIKLI